jgi:hypothetical protein
VRRPTLIVLIVLLSLLVAAAVWQVLIASQDHPRFPVPASPTQPSASPMAAG